MQVVVVLQMDIYKRLLPQNINQFVIQDLKWQKK